MDYDIYLGRSKAIEQEMARIRDILDQQAIKKHKTGIFNQSTVDRAFKDQEKALKDLNELAELDKKYWGK